MRIVALVMLALLLATALLHGRACSCNNRPVVMRPQLHRSRRSRSYRGGGATPRITASGSGRGLSLAAGGRITAAAATRTLSGVVVKWNVPGHTSRGLLKVAPGALTFPDDLGTVKLTREHDRQASRGHLIAIDQDETGIRASLRVSDGPEGDDALREAQDRTRDGLSFDIVDAIVDGDTITAGYAVAIGQVGIPAYADGRIDSIAASNTPGDTMLTKQQRARLKALGASTTRTDVETAEFGALCILGGFDPATFDAATYDADADPSAATETPTQPAAATPAAGAPSPAPAAQPVQVAASLAAVPAGVPTPTVTVRENGRNALNAVVRGMTEALNRRTVGERVAGITAALADVIHTDHTGDIEQPAWSGELWSGLQYAPKWSDLLGQGTLTNWTGRGWRFLTTPSMQAYAGDKADVPTGTVTTEDSTYTAAREAVAVDIDRKFYDFGQVNEEFVRRLLEKIRETWEIRKDIHSRTFILANYTPATRAATVSITSGDATVTAAAGTFKASDVGATFTATSGVPAATTILSVTNSGSIELSANASATGSRTATIGVQEPSVLKAAARAMMDLDSRRVATRADWLMLNSEDMFTLLDLTNDDVPAFLNLWGIEPGNFRHSADQPRGVVSAGVRQAATFRELPGSPIRVSAQNIAEGGVDEGFFGYWAIEENHTSGIVSTRFVPA